MTSPPFPVIRLRPKTSPKPVRFGAPWLYDNEIVTDRRTRALAPGTIALLEDARAGIGGVAASDQIAPIRIAGGSGQEQ